MFVLVNKANSVFVKSDSDAQMRIGFWRGALACAVALQSLVDLSYDLKQVSMETTRSWVGDIVEVQSLIRSRISTETKRYANG